MSFEDADAIPLATPIQQTQVLQKGNLRAEITPRYLARADILVLRMLMDNDVRRLHFSRTSADLAEQLGLAPYIVTQGMTRRVMPDTVRESETIVRVPGEGYVDAARTEALWREYRSPESLIEKNDWIDYPSRGIPFLVLNTGIITAEALARVGKQAASDSVLQVARQVGIATRFGDVIGEPLPPAPAIPSGDSAVRVPVPTKTP
jgi:hypothetical protein